MKMTRLMRTPLLALVFVCILNFVAHAQSGTATFSGTVQDSNGAVVVGATVTIADSAKGLKRTAVTNDEGYFAVPLLPASSYTVTIESQGFSTVQIPDLVLNVGDQKAVRIGLKVGDVKTEVVVNAEDAEVVRTDGSVGTVINRQQIANMPLNGRSLQALIQLTPGVVLTNGGAGNSNSATSNGQFSIGGQRESANYFTLDGVSVNTGTQSTGNAPGLGATGQTPGTTALGGTNSIISLDALQEFRIDTSSYAAEYGRSPGGQISLVSRSGTNKYTGSVFEYFRNEAMDANDWFANANRLRRPAERQNFFGGVLGGPLPYPHFGEGGPAFKSGKDKLFFFLSYEGLRLQQPNVKTINVPTVAIRSQVNAFLKPFVNAIPLPNGPGNFVSCTPATDPACGPNGLKSNGTAQFAASYSDPGSFNIFSLKIDGNITKNLSGFFRLNHAPSQSDQRTLNLAVIARTEALEDSYTMGATWIAKANLTADLRVNWTMNAPKYNYRFDNFGGAVVPNPADIFAPGRDPSNSRFDLSLGGGGGWSFGTQAADIQHQLNPVGTLTWVAGSHQTKFGFDYRRLTPRLREDSNNIEILGYSNALALLQPTASYYYIGSADPNPIHPIIDELSLFAQDSWRIRRRLTLTFGLRFEHVPPPRERDGRLPLTLVGLENDPIPTTLHFAPAGTPVFNNRFGSFAPRVGVAYQLGAKTGWETILRGGAGMYYDVGFGNATTAMVNYPFLGVAFYSGPSIPLSSSFRVSPNPLITGPAGSLAYPDPTIKLPYTLQWNGSIEQSLGRSQTITISYSAAAGRRLVGVRTYRGVVADFPQNGTISIGVTKNIAKSDYRSLQVQYQRRFSHRVQALASYTLAESKDNASADLGNAFGATADILKAEYGPSDFDVRHVFSSSISYEIPGASGHSIAERLTKGWGADLLIRYQSAFPVNASGFTQIVNGQGVTFRPNLVTGQPLYLYGDACTASNHGVPCPGGRRINPGALQNNTSTTTQGTLPRNFFRGFSALQFDLAVRREFTLREGVRLQLRGEAFNVFNHPNFGPLDNFFFSGTFGMPSQMLGRTLGGLNALYQMGGPRSGQLSARISF